MQDMYAKTSQNLMKIKLSENQQKIVLKQSEIEDRKSPRFSSKNHEIDSIQSKFDIIY